MIGGLSAEMTLKTVKLLSTRYLDSLLVFGNELGRGFRDVDLEKKVTTICVTGIVIRADCQ